MIVVAFLTTVLMGQTAVNGYDPITRLTVEQRAAKDKIEALGGKVWMCYDPKLPAAESIAFKEEQFTDAQLSLLAPFHAVSLRGLAFVRAKLSDDGVARALSHFPELKSITVFQMAVGDAALKPLEQLTLLEDVDLSGSQITSASIAHIAHQPAIQYLYFSETKVDDAGLKHLEGLARLKHLFMANTRITSAGLASLAKIKSLESLLLDDSQVDDAGVKHLATLERLRTLGLERTRITNEGMESLGALKSLKTLYVENTSVNADGLKLLQDMPNLTAVRWEGWRVPTPETRRFNTLFHLHLPANANVEAWKKDRDKYERGELELDFP